MIKKVFVVCVLLFSNIISVSANVNLTPNAGASILIESTSGQILNAYNAEEKMFPASTTKIMTMILLFEAINDGRISFDDIVTTSSYASSMGGSQVYLETGETMSVLDIFKSIAIASANDASVAIGEKIGGTIEQFVAMMNDKATELCLKNTNFINVTGLHDDNHYTCAYDLGIMAQYLIEIGSDELFNVTSMYDSYIRENSGEKFWLVNTNKLLKLYDGVDGLKTGYTKEAGYCLVSTVERNGVRLIGVILNESDPSIRNSEMCSLLDYGFSSFKKEVLFENGDIVDNLSIINSEIQNLDIVVLEEVSYILNVNNIDDISYEIEYFTNEPPIYSDVAIGVLKLFVGDNISFEYDVFSVEDVEKESIFKKTWNQFKRFL